MEDDINQPYKAWGAGYVYVIDYGNQTTFKIGYTKNLPSTRLKAICGTSVVMPMDMVFYSQIDTNAYYVEQLLHMSYDGKHHNGEWFDLDFVELTDIAVILQQLGSLEYTDHWYEKVVPTDYMEYIKNYAINPHLVSFTKDTFAAPVKYEMMSSV